ncbi:phospholipase, patatin family [Dictyocaulus viviparus]|uniref:Phospholipase, patatin family n=1 Tax=Dictyocaulus viviparus TaxID=29172 RepID=A0A0D8XZU1_DICVI|nr:phospholipase, patatin family [Dictyocaulus viviparus]
MSSEKHTTSVGVVAQWWSHRSDTMPRILFSAAARAKDAGNQGIIAHAKLSWLQEAHKVYVVDASLSETGLPFMSKERQSSILRAIEEELGENLMSRVHWVGGTSCGGIISLALGAGLTVEQTRRIFLSGRHVTFCGNSSVLPKHNSNGIEDMLKVSFGTHTTMGDLKPRKVLVTASRVKSAPPQLVLFRSYAPRITSKEYEKYGYMNPEKILMWKAGRATSRILIIPSYGVSLEKAYLSEHLNELMFSMFSLKALKPFFKDLNDKLFSAAPIFFESFHGLADGAIFCNNPCVTMMTDFFRCEMHRWIEGVVVGFQKNDDKIGCIITIGSGVEPALQLGGIDINLKSPFALGREFMNVFGKGKNLITLFLYQCTSSHSAVSQAREWAHSLGIPYFRFSPRLTRAFDLDSIASDGIFDFMFETEVYLRTQAHEDIEILCRLLKTMPKIEMLNYNTTIH